MSDPESLTLHWHGSTTYRYHDTALLYDDPPLPPYDHRSDHISRASLRDIEYRHVLHDHGSASIPSHRIRGAQSRPLHIHRASELDTRDLRRSDMV